MDSQNAQILEALKAGEQLTALDALNRFGCFRLASRISDIKQQFKREGKDPNLIQTTMVGEGRKRYASYTLKPAEPTQGSLLR